MKFKPARASVRAAVSAVTVLSGAALTQVHASEELHSDAILDEIIVTTNLQKTLAETALPVNILSGERLRENASATLGDTLQELVGVNSSSFGTGVGLPVIRGQSGKRVQVLQGGLSNIDASSVSPDHANSVEPALAERIEVLRGPATLLYGNGAIGGVVNVIDNRIPLQVPPALTGLIETRHDSASDQQSSVMKLEGGAGQVAWHLDASYRDSNDTVISGYAINPDTADLDDEEAFEEMLDSDGVIANSNTRNSAVTAGLSWVFERGHLGFAVSESRNDYGLPPAAHAHHEHEEEGHDEEDHDEDHDHDHDEDHEHEEGHGGGGVRIAMKQQRLDMEGELAFDSFIENLQGKVSVVDYEHAEIEPGGEVGTVYANKGSESRFVFDHRQVGALDGVIGFQFGSKEFTAYGEEAYLAPTDIDSTAVFSVQSLDAGALTYEFGVRVEHQHMEQSGACSQSETSVSGSASALWRNSESTNVLLAISHAERAPTVEELFSNIDQVTCGVPADEHDLVAHAATQRFEIGNPQAEKERSGNIELGFRKHLGAVQGELNLFYNSISDYLYLQDTGTFEDDVEIAVIRQEDAVFQGMEAELGFPVSRSDTHLTELKLFGDYVQARFDRSGDVPRIPAARLGFEVSHAHADWAYRLRLTRVAEQDRVAVNETPTDSYTLVNVTVDWHGQWGNSEVLVFGKASNLLDETIRNHTSLLKDVAPEAGRGVELGVRLSF